MRWFDVMREMPLKAVLAASCLVAAAAVHGQAANEEEEMIIAADSTEYDIKSGKAIAKGAVEITYSGMTLKADEVAVDQNTTDVTVSGNVHFSTGGFRLSGEQGEGNIQAQTIKLGPSRGQMDEWYFRTSSSQRDESGRIFLGHATLSTCSHVTEDDERPHYSISSQGVVRHPDGWFKAYHTWVKLGPIPIIYLPYVSGHTERASGWRLQVGHDSDYRSYVMLGKELELSDDLSTEFMVDFREKHGLALGNRTEYKTATSQTEFLVYGMHDRSAPETDSTPGYNRRFDIVDDRFRLQLSHRQQFTDRLTLRMNVDALSDIDMLEDWFEDEYRPEPQPQTFLDLTYQGDRLNLSLHARPQVNDHFSVVERLPELRFAMPRQTIGNTGLQYQAHSTAANLRMSWRDFDMDRAGGFTDPEDYNAFRFDSGHLLYYPLQLGIFQVVPRAGVRATYYSESSETAAGAGLSDFFLADDPDDPASTADVTNYDDLGGSRWRWAGETGIELSTRFFKTWPGVNNLSLGLNGLRHVVRPYVNYNYAPEPSEERDTLYFFDEVDRLAEQHFVRVGVRQEFQTRRSDQIYTMASLDTYADYHFARAEEQDRLGDFGLIARFAPPEAAYGLSGRMAVDMEENKLRHASFNSFIGRRVRATFSYAFHEGNHGNGIYSMGSTLYEQYAQSWLARQYRESHTVSLGVQFPFFSPKTAADIRCTYDLVEEEWASRSITFTRDLHCLVGSVGVRNDAEDDYMLTFLLYLKAYPGMRVHTAMDYDEDDE